mgnify:CR=1 FL=1
MFFEPGRKLLDKISDLWDLFVGKKCYIIYYYLLLLLLGFTFIPINIVTICIAAVFSFCGQAIFYMVLTVSLVNTIEYNNITIHAKRTIGIATNASNNNNYRYNNINLYCNDDTINYFYETIPAQNVGIIIIGSNANNIQYNNITINEDSTNTNTYAIILEADSLNNIVMYNKLYVYNNFGVSKQGDNAVNNLGTNNYVANNMPTLISLNN